MPIPMGARPRSVPTWRRALCPLVLGSLALVAGAQSTPPHAAFTTNPFPARGEELMTVQFLDQSSGAITTWHWSFGDGASSSERSPSHTYFGFGNFDVTLTVTGPG